MRRWTVTVQAMFFVGSLVLLVAEIAAFVAVGEHIGFGWAVLILLGVSAFGPFVVRRVGVGVLLRTQRRLAGGELPTKELLDGVVVLLGGVLICVPGFITDAVGLLLMLAPVRLLFIRSTGRRVARRVETMSPSRWRVINVAARTDDGGSPTRPGTGPPELREAEPPSHP
jgi:UPF0716 protein FxsA